MDYREVKSIKSVWLQLGWFLLDAPQTFLCTHSWCPECSQAGDNPDVISPGSSEGKKGETPQLALDGLFHSKWDVIIQFFPSSITEKKNQVSQIWSKHPESIQGVLFLECFFSLSFLKSFHLKAARVRNDPWTDEGAAALWCAGCEQ